MFCLCFDLNEQINLFFYLLHACRTFLPPKKKKKSSFNSRKPLKLPANIRHQTQTSVLQSFYSSFRQKTKDSFCITVVQQRPRVQKTLSFSSFFQCKNNSCHTSHLCRPLVVQTLQIKVRHMMETISQFSYT